MPERTEPTAESTQRQMADAAAEAEHASPETDPAPSEGAKEALAEAAEAVEVAKHGNGNGGEKSSNGGGNGGATAVKVAPAKPKAKKAQPKPKADKPQAPAVNHTELIAEIADGLFDATVDRKSHTRFELEEKQVVYGERRKGSICLVIPVRLITDEKLLETVTVQPWHGGKALLSVLHTKASVNEARKLLRHVIHNYKDQRKAVEKQKAETVEKRKESQKEARARARADKEKGKAQAAKK